MSLEIHLTLIYASQGTRGTRRKISNSMQEKKKIKYTFAWFSSFLASKFLSFQNLAILQLGMTTKMMLHRRPHSGCIARVGIRVTTLPPFSLIIISNEYTSD